MVNHDTIDIDDPLIHMLNQVLPNHLWITGVSLRHIDEWRTCIVGPDKDSIIVSNSIGYISNQHFTSIVGIDRNKFTDYRDVLYVFPSYTYDPISFSNFLGQVGGNVELYKDIIILTTGVNPWH